MYVGGNTVKLLQGDLSESWREGDVDYATVAMRYGSLDVVRDRTSGKVLAGSPDEPVETTEVWTFRRETGPWGGGDGVLLADEDDFLGLLGDVIRLVHLAELAEFLALVAEELFAAFE